MSLIVTFHNWLQLAFLKVINDEFFTEWFRWSDVIGEGTKDHIPHLETGIWDHVDKIEVEMTHEIFELIMNCHCESERSFKELFEYIYNLTIMD